MIPGFIVALVALTALLPAVSDATAIGAAIKVVLPTITVGLLPGAVVTLWSWPAASLGLLEFLAISTAVSLGLMHLVTVAIILAHSSVPFASIAVLVVLAAAAVALFVRRGASLKVRIDADDVLGLLVLATLACALYVQGSPVADWEDQVHVSIVRRLAALDHLTLDNFYLTPQVIYTYPFPSTHAFMAFVARLGGIDALFVYHKLRFFWGPTAILMIYLGALSVFGARAIASAALVTAGILTLNGMFAVVEGSYWGQLSTFSHASDVAMAVLLPALLALSYRFIESDAAFERPLLFAAATALSFTLAVVHVRELVQYIAYLAWFIAVAAFVSSFRRKAARAGALIASALAAAVLFLVWHNHAVTHITDLVDAQRVKLVAIAHATPTRNLLLTPAANVLPTFVQWVDAPFNGITPLLLLASPIALVAFRQRPLVWLMAVSGIVYLVVMNVPALAIPYVYLTYYEILITPIRNLIPFIHMLAGPVLCVVAAWIWFTVRPTAVAALLLVAVGGVLGVVGRIVPLAVNRGELRFFVPAILAWAAILVYFGRGEPRQALKGWRLAVSVAVIALTAAALWPDHPPELPPVYVNVRWTNGLRDTQREQLERRFSLVEFQRLADPDTRVYQITDQSVDNVRAIVTDPAVRDTHHIDRATFDVEQPPRPWDRYPDASLLVLTTFTLVLCGFVLPTLAGVNTGTVSRAIEQFVAAPFGRRILIVGLLATPLFVLTWSQHLAPLVPTGVRPFGYAATPSAILPQTECTERDGVKPPLGDSFQGGPVTISRVVSCPPDQALADWTSTHVPVTAIFAVDRWNNFPPTMFLPQQVVTLSGFEFSLPNEDEITPVYARWYRASMRDHGVQPFFNERDTPEERQAFLRELGVTHVLVDPQYYPTLRTVLDALPQLVTRRYDDGQWAVYEVRQQAAR